MSSIVIASIVLGAFVFLSALYIRGGLITLALSNQQIAHEIHVHAETLNEFKHEYVKANIGLPKEQVEFNRRIKARIGKGRRNGKSN